MTETQLTLHLLGPFQLKQGLEESVVTLRRKTRALLAYLIATKQPHTRQSLTDLFCQEAKSPARALSVLLTRIRQQVGTAVLRTAEEMVQVSLTEMWVDYDQLQQQLSGDLARHSTAALKTAVSLYRGEFLEGLSLPDAPEFELWLLGQRAHTRRLYERGLLALVQQLIQQDAAETAVRYARQLLQHNPLLEEAHAQLIWLYAQTGQYEAALRQYAQCCTLLQTELGVAPTDDLRQLHAAVLARQPAAPWLTQPLQPSGEAAVSAADFTGRVQELASLQNAWQQVQRERRGRVILIGAAAGRGKTRLVHEFRRPLPDTAVYIGHCYESTRALSYQPWVEILEAHWQQLDTAAREQLAPAVLGNIGRLLPGLGHASPSMAAELVGAPEQLCTAVVDFLAHDGGTVPSPRLIFLEDVQWADEASLRLLHYVVQRSGRFPWLLIATYRSEEAAETPSLALLLADLERQGVPHVSLAPLTMADMATLAKRFCPQLTPHEHEQLVARLAQATGGNALFVTAVLRELSTAASVSAELPVPATVQDLLYKRLQRLSQGERQVLETLAVWGDGGSLAHLQELSARSADEVALALEWGGRWQLLQVDTTTTPITYTFHHDLARQGIYASLTAVRRQRLHQRAAVWLSQTTQHQPEAVRQERAGRILYHAWLGEAFELVFRWAPLAAVRARQLFAYQEALQILDKMRHAYDQLPHRPAFAAEAEPVLFAQLIWWLVHSRALGKTAAEEQPVLQQARALLSRHPSPLREAQLYFVTAQYTLNYQEAIPAMEAAYERFLWLEEPSMAALALAQAASAAITISRNRDGRMYYQRALALYQAAEDNAGEILCLSGLAWTAINLGEIAVALRYAEQSLAISQAQGDRLGEARALFGLAAAWGFYHAPEQVEAAARASKQLYEQMGFKHQALQPLLYIAATHDIRGEWQRALAIYEETLEKLLLFEDEWIAGWLAQLAGRIYLRNGDLEAAERRLQQARQFRLASGERQNQVSDLVWLGRLALQRGEVTAAGHHTKEAMALLETFGGEFYVWEQPDVLMARAEALAAAGQTAEAYEMVQKAYVCLHQFAQQIDDPEVRACYLAYPLNARVETAVATQRIAPLFG